MPHQRLGHAPGNEQGEYAIYDPYNPSLDRGPCSFNSNQVFTSNAIYGLPFHGNRAVNGWQISPIFSHSKGLPINVQNRVFAVSIQHWRLNRRRASAERVPGCNPLVRKIHEWCNPACFVLQPYGTIGNSGRDSLNNPNYFNMDLSLMKNTKLTEKIKRAAPGGVLRYPESPQLRLGSQAYLMSTYNNQCHDNSNYSQLNNPAAYEPPNPATGSAGGAICNPSGSPTAGCGRPLLRQLDGFGVAIGNREIQFAVKLNF